MRKTAIVMGAMLLLAAALRVVSAHEAMNLPPGPIHDRHELMEGIGKNAKIIGNALKAGNTEGVEVAAGKIGTSATKITALFPKGSTDPKSRAKPAIWTNWKKFEETANLLAATAGELGDATRSGGDVKAAASKMFGACKTCHDDFRKPEKKKK